MQYILNIFLKSRSWNSGVLCKVFAVVMAVNEILKNHHERRTPKWQTKKLLLNTYRKSLDGLLAENNALFAV